jgi:hypothetical protein
VLLRRASNTFLTAPPPEEWDGLPLVAAGLGPQQLHAYMLVCLLPGQLAHA